jgi:hypothetical protein
MQNEYGVRSLGLRSIIALSLLLSWPLLGAFGQERGISVAKRIVGNPDFDLGKQFAVIIGIDKYAEWPSLKSAAAEARKIRSILADRYEIDEFIELYDADASAANIRKVFTEQLPKKVGINDSVFIFYSGHGYLDKSSTGFWIASDGTRDENDQRGWIPNAQLRNYISPNMLKAQRVLVVADSCFSGDFMNVSRGALPNIDNAYYRKALQLTARQILTSGASESVPDESEFGRQLINLLERNSEAVIDPVTMYDRIRLGVTRTQPLFGTIPGHEQGATFALFRKTTAEATGALSVTARTKGELFVDGSSKGMVAAGASVSLDALKAGAHSLEMRYEDSTEKQDATVKPDSTLAVSFQYQPKAKVGSLTIRGLPLDCSIAIDGSSGVSLGQDSGAGLRSLIKPSLSIGSHVVEVSSTIGKASLRTTVDVVESGVALDIRTGKFELTGLPKDAQVQVGGKALAFEPDLHSGLDGLLSPSLLPGDYQVAVSGTYMESASLAAKVVAGDTRIQAVSVREFGLLKPILGPSLDPKKVKLELRAAGDAAMGDLSPGEAVKLDEGDYRVLASFADDIEAGRTIALRVRKGATQELKLDSLQYSVAYRVKAKAEERSAENKAYDKAKASLQADFAKAAKSKKSLSVAGWASLGLGIASAGGAAACYVLGSQAKADYDAAGSSAKTAELRKKVDQFSMLFSVSLGAGGGLLGLSPLFLSLGPSPAKVQARITTLDKGHADKLSSLDSELAILAAEKK